MAGIYLHIPFCRKACHYCDFHFSTSLAKTGEMTQGIAQELVERKGEMQGQKIETIYFGGGTPSLLPIPDLSHLLHVIYDNFEVDSNIECTLEANPDDCSPSNLKEWKSLGINRLSIGVQSFNQHDLEWMNRSHNSEQASSAIEASAAAGFEHINLDLIYGVPSMSNTIWESNVKRALELPIDHISAYSLTVEPKTALHHFITSNKYPPLDDEKAVREFEYLQQQIKDRDWEHYEISNYCKPGNYAVHNTNYWKQRAYLGVGPSAHSYDGKIRRWNVANNAHYMERVRTRVNFWEEEELSVSDRVNEAIMLGLRTKWGVDLDELQHVFGVDLMKSAQSHIANHAAEGRLFERQNTLILTDLGKSFADQIASDLFV